MVKVNSGWSAALRGMGVGDKVIFPVRSISSINSIIVRLRLEMCQEGANWKRVGKIDKENGEFTIQRIA